MVLDQVSRPYRRMRLNALIIAIAATVSACGTEGLPNEAPQPALFDGLADCGVPDSPIAAFWGSDEGVGVPGRNADSPTGGDIWGITADGRVAAITNDAKSRDPWLSDDGRRLYFTRSAGGIVAGAAAPGIEVWVRELASGEETMLFRADTNVEGTEVSAPEGSPDGKSVAFQAPAGQLMQQYVYVMTTEPIGEPVQIPMPASTGRIHGQREPTWSSDGSELAYVYHEVDDLGQIFSSIRIVNLLSNAERSLYAPAEPVSLLELDWTPDGSALLAEERSTLASGTSEGSTVVSIDSTSGERSVLATQVGVPTTLSSSGGAVTGIGTLRSWSNETEIAKTPELMTWGSDSTSRRELPSRFAFATSLTIADCSFIRIEE